MQSNTMIDLILGHEGGYVNRPSDPGGETKFGISKRAYPKENIRALTRARAVELYLRDYYERPGLSLIPLPALRYCVLDFGVNAGTSRAVKLLQRLVGAGVDGRMGKGTAAAVARFLSQHGDVSTIQQYQDARVRYYKGLNKPAFEKGWLNRVREVTARAIKEVQA